MEWEFRVIIGYALPMIEWVDEGLYAPFTNLEATLRAVEELRQGKEPCNMCWLSEIEIETFYT